MRFLAPILSPLLAAILLCASNATGQDRPRADDQHDARPKYDSISFAGGYRQISDPASVPRQLTLAAEQLNCQFRDDIKEQPIQLISAEGRRIALVFCRSGVGGSHQVFDFEDLRKPRRVELPFIAEKSGFGTTPRPGLITWKRDAGLFEAVSGSDMCSNSELRHTYRLGSTEGPISRVASFVVVRVEARDQYCSGTSGEWTTVWEAPPWPKSVVVH